MFIGQNELNQNAEGSLKRNWMKSVLGLNISHKSLLTHLAQETGV
jgi:hypothetical protein